MTDHRKKAETHLEEVDRALRAGGARVQDPSVGLHATAAVAHALLAVGVRVGSGFSSVYEVLRATAEERAVGPTEHKG